MGAERTLMKIQREYPEREKAWITKVVNRDMSSSGTFGQNGGAMYPKEKRTNNAGG